MYYRVQPRYSSPCNRMPPPPPPHHPSAPYNSPRSSCHQGEYSWIAQPHLATPIPPSAPQNSAASLAISKSSQASSYLTISRSSRPSSFMEESSQQQSRLCPNNNSSSFLSSALTDNEVHFCSMYDYPQEDRRIHSYGSQLSESQSSLMSIDVDQSSKYSDSDRSSENNSLSPSDVTESCLDASLASVTNPWNHHPPSYHQHHQYLRRADTTVCSCNVTRSECTSLGERPECIGHEQDLSIMYRYNSLLQQRGGHPNQNSPHSGYNDTNVTGDSFSVIDSDFDTDWNNSHMDDSCTTCCRDDMVSLNSAANDQPMDNMNCLGNSSLCLLSVPCPINVNKYKLPSFLGNGEKLVQSLESLHTGSEHTYESIQSRSSRSSTSHSDGDHYYKSLRHSRHLSQATMDIHKPVPNRRSTTSGGQKHHHIYDSLLLPEIEQFNHTQLTQSSDVTEFMQKPLCGDALTSGMSKSRKKVLRRKLKTVGRFIQQLSKTQRSKPSNLKTLAYV